MTKKRLQPTLGNLARLKQFVGRSGKRMDDLEILANSRTRMEGTEADGDEAHFSAVSALRWPLLILGIVVGLPLLFCLVFFSSLGKGHPPGIIVPILYVFFVTPFAAPLGVWFSAAAFARHPTVRGSALILMTLFVLGAIASWIWFVPFITRGKGPF